MRTRFFACAVCSRHVRAGDSVCPFCGANAPEAPPLRTVTERLSRAAMHTAGAAGVVVAISDCGVGETHGVPFYGAACIDGSCGVTVVDSGNDAIDAYDGNIGVFYGAPCIDGGCWITDAGTAAADASPDGGEDSGDATAGDAGDDGGDSATDDAGDDGPG